MKFRTVVLTLLLVLCCITNALAQQGADVTKMAGYIDLDDIEIPEDAEEITDIDLGPAMLKMAFGVDRDTDSDLADALSRIYSIRVKGFEVGYREVAQIEDAIDKIEARLKADRWERLIYVKNRDERITVNIIQVEDKIGGLMVIVFEPEDQVMFINIVGDIDLADLAKVAGEIDDVDLEEIIEDLQDEADKDDDEDKDRRSIDY